MLNRAARLLGEQPRAGGYGEVDFLLRRSQENVQGIVACRETGTWGPRGLLQLPVPGDLPMDGQGAISRTMAIFTYINSEVEVAIRVESAKAGRVRVRCRVPAVLG